MDDYLLLFVVIVIVVSFFGSQNVIIFTRVIWNHMLEGPQTVSSRQDRTVPFKATLARSPKCLISVSYQNIRKFHQNIMKFTSGPNGTFQSEGRQKIKMTHSVYYQTIMQFHQNIMKFHQHITKFHARLIMSKYHEISLKYHEIFNIS